MQINNLDNYMDELANGDGLYDEANDDVYLAADTIVIPGTVHFLGTADRRAKYRKKQAELKKASLAELDEYEVAMQA